MSINGSAVVSTISSCHPAQTDGRAAAEAILIEIWFKELTPLRKAPIVIAVGRGRSNNALLQSTDRASRTGKSEDTHFSEEEMDSGTISVPTHKHMELVDITGLVSEKVRQAEISTGTCFLFNPHTTAGLTINEGADPAVRDDIIAGLKKIVPLHYPFKHMEGNSPAHIMASLMGCSETLLIEEGQLVLGTWQKIFFCEFDGPRNRKLRYRIS